MRHIDWNYIYAVLPALVFAFWAHFRVKSTFKKFSKLNSNSKMTGAQAAKQILEANGIHGVKIEKVAGKLTDHFDPRSNTIKLSYDVYDSKTCAAIGVACHEVGHAMQYAENYFPIKIRSAIIPVTNIGSSLSFPLVMIGLILTYYNERFILLAYIGVALFAVVVLFQLVTLPVEYNASHRALICMRDNMILYGEDLEGARRVLFAASLTYVAAVAVSISQLLYLLARVKRK